MSAGWANGPTAGDVAFAYRALLAALAERAAIWREEAAAARASRQLAVPDDGGVVLASLAVKAAQLDRCADELVRATGAPCPDCGSLPGVSCPPSCGRLAEVPDGGEAPG